MMMMGRLRERSVPAIGGFVLALLLGLASGPVGAADCPGDCDDNGAVTVNELVLGVHLALQGPAGGAGVMSVCTAFDLDGNGVVTIDELLEAVGAALRGCPRHLVAFSAALEAEGPALLVTPATALRGGRSYALVLTRGVRDAGGAALEPSADFAALLGIDAGSDTGPVALYDDDPETDGNPYPDPRLIRPDGSVHIPDRFALRGLADSPELATARRLLRTNAAAIGEARGFSTTAPMRIALSAPVDLDTVNEDTVLLFERRDGGVDLEGLLAAAGRLGVPRAAIALAISFRTQPIEDDLLAARERLLELAAAEPFEVDFDDPDPEDDLALGLFGPEDPEFAAFLAANPEVALVGRGLIRSPDFRDENGIFDPALLAGERPPEDQQLDFLLTVPLGSGPHRVAILQHGFAGDNRFVLDLAGLLAREGIAAIGISAVSHGRRGSPLALLQATPVQSRELFRQTHVDLMALVRAIEAGIDVDGDGTPDLETERIAYLGVSLGGIIGATFAALEEKIEAAVLNVAGGRVAFLGDNPGTRPIFTSYLAAEADLDVQSPEFEVFLQRSLELGQQALDPADGLNYARYWNLEPLPGFVPRRVLMQEGIGDLLVSNESTEALAAAGGLVADTPQSSAAGVSGLWRFDPPGGHGILARADVRAQAVIFLATRGTVIVDPAVPDPACAVRFTDDNSAPEAPLCVFRGGWNESCGSADLDAGFVGDGAIVAASVLRLGEPVFFGAEVISPTEAELRGWFTREDLSDFEPLDGRLRLADGGRALVIEPGTVPFDIDGCDFVAYRGALRATVAGSP
jgi:dienelactone hydrolase